MADDLLISPNETSFETPRGVNRIEVRAGFSQIHVSGLEVPVMGGRLRVLRAVADAGVSIDFLKLTPTGLSFLVAEEHAASVGSAISGGGVSSTVSTGRSIVLVHAVNIRDEEGMISSIVQAVIASGTTLDHVGDMHDRMLLVVETQDAPNVVRHLSKSLGAAT